MKRIAFLLLLLIPLTLAACGVNDNDSAPPDTTSSQYTFEGSTIDSGVWNIYQQPPSTIGQRDGKLVVNLADGAAAYSTLYTVRTGFSGVTAAAAIGDVPRGAGAEAIMQLAVADQQRHFIAAEDGRLYMGTQVDESFLTKDIAFDPVAQRYWRLNSNLIAGRMAYETSADGVTWVVENDTKLVLPLDNAYFELGAGTYKNVTSPGIASFTSVMFEGTFAP